MNTEKLAKQLESCKSNEDTLKVLAENGIEITAEEMNEVMNQLQPQETTGELDENALEDVAGGILLPRITRIIPPVKPLITSIRWWR